MDRQPQPFSAQLLEQVTATFVGEGEQIFNVKTYGAKGDGTTDDTAAINAAQADAAAVKGSVGFPPGTYLADQLVISNGDARWVGLGGSILRFGAGSVADAGVRIKHVSGSTKTLLDIQSTGATLENIYLDGNSAPEAGLKISNGFEVRLDKVRIAYVAGIGLDLRGSCNTSYNDVFVDNCGTVDLPAVRAMPASPRTINTLDFYGLTIERQPGMALDLGPDVDATTNNYPEFIRITNLHIETAKDSGGSANTVPLMRVRNFRSLTLVNPFIFGGPG
ncbi:glycosyl hydrolase family 28-related protein [Crystallibacter degradans]|uniref:glycosyl hydrolase family 28-related protein n=1 Tax=Crystallibacter degradans TaxID=2726743 RepID=UPI001475872B|nr:hypothetical protein [Arthrobacter sp. SF27]